MRGVLSVLGVGVTLTLIVAMCWMANGLDQTGQRVAQTDQQVAQIATDLATPQERIVNLPEDGAVYHTILLLHANWRSRPNERRLVSWFRTEPALVSLAAQTHYWEVTEDDPSYEATYKATTPTLPAVLVLKTDGEVAYKISGKNLPDSPKPMTCELLRIFKWRHQRAYPDGCTPPPKPDDKDAKPVVDTKVDVDVRPPVLEEPPGSSDAVIWIAVIGSILTAIAVFVIVIVRKFKSEVGL